jgi:hypothetical protein
LEELLKAQKVQLTNKTELKGGPEGKPVDVAGVIGSDQIGAPIRHVAQAVDLEAAQQTEDEAEDLMGEERDGNSPGLVALCDLGPDTFWGLTCQDLVPRGAAGLSLFLDDLRVFSQTLMYLNYQISHCKQLGAGLCREIDPE